MMADTSDHLRLDGINAIASGEKPHPKALSGAGPRPVRKVSLGIRVEGASDKDQAGGLRPGTAPGAPTD